MDNNKLWDKLEKMDGKLDAMVKSIATVATRAETAHARLNGVQQECQDNRNAIESTRGLAVKLFLGSIGLIASVFAIVQLT